MRMFGELTPKELDRLELSLTKYCTVESAIVRRKQEMEAERKKVDNLGIRTDKINSPVEGLVIAWDEDLVLQGIAAYKACVDKLIRKLEGNRLEIFYLRWIDNLLWEEIAERLNLSMREVKRIRKIILSLYAKIVVIF